MTWQRPQCARSSPAQPAVHPPQVMWNRCTSWATHAGEALTSPSVASSFGSGHPGWLTRWMQPVPRARDRHRGERRRSSRRGRGGRPARSVLVVDRDRVPGRADATCRCSAGITSARPAAPRAAGRRAAGAAGRGRTLPGRVRLRSIPVTCSGWARPAGRPPRGRSSGSCPRRARCSSTFCGSGSLIFRTSRSPGIPRFAGSASTPTGSAGCVWPTAAICPPALSSTPAAATRACPPGCTGRGSQLGRTGHRRPDRLRQPALPGRPLLVRRDRAVHPRHPGHPDRRLSAPG